MDDLTTLANANGRGLRIFKGLIAEDATGPNDMVPVRIPTYDPSRQFGPCHFAPRLLNDGSPLFPNRNDECTVCLDENDNAEILNWWAEDPTDLGFTSIYRQLSRGSLGAGWSTSFTAATTITTMLAIGNFTTPDKNSWVHVRAQAPIRCMDAAWHGIEIALQIDPPNLGVGGTINIAKTVQSHNSAAGPSVPAIVAGSFYLPKNITKSIIFKATPTSGNWQVRRDEDYLMMEAVVIPEYGQLL